MAADGTLRFDTRIDSDGFNKGTASITQNLGKLKNSLLKIGSIVGISFGIKSLISFGKAAIETASDVQEVQNVVDVAFGEMKYKMEEFADTAIETYGISELAAKQTGSTLMAMATGMGIADEAASDMALTLTGLSADMSSFYNKEQEETFTALKGVFTGETEALKSYGIVMTETNLQEYAYTQGINKKISAMSQAEKVQLRYNFILKQTSLAEGDFARTSQGWANQTRILSELWKEFSGTIGTIFINVLLPAVQSLNKAMLQLNAVAQSALESMAAIFDWDIETNNSTTSTINESVEAQNTLTDATEATAKANEKTLAGFDKINKLNDNSSSGSSAGVSSGGGGTTESMRVEVNTTSAEKKLTDFQQKIKEFVASLKLTFNDVFIDWEDLNGEQIAEKILAGLFAIAGGVAGFTIGGVPGAIIGTLLGVALSLVISSLTFDHDGSLSVQEILSLITMALTGIAGGVIGFSSGGVGGAAVGISLGASLGLLLNELTFDTDDSLNGEEIAKYIVSALTMLTSGAIGFSLGGVQGAAIGITFGTVISGLITDISFNSDGTLSGDEFWGMIMTALLGIVGGIIGFAVGGPAGAAAGVMIGVSLSMIVNQVDYEDLGMKFETFINDLGEDLENLGIEAKQLFTDLKDSAKEKIGKACDNIEQFFSDTGDKIEQTGKDIGTFFSDLWADTKQSVNDCGDSVKEAWNNIPSWFDKNITTPVSGFFSDLWTDTKQNASDAYNGTKEAFATADTWFRDKFSSAMTKIKDVFSVNTVKTHFDSVKTGITDTFSKIPDWFKDKFSTAWQKVKDVFSKGGEVFSGIKDGILSALKSVINGLIDGINKVIKTPFDGINTALKKIRDISIAGVKPFESKISLISVPQIPKLATGTVVPANYGEFLAVLGDNKRETEVVSPLSTIKKALAEVLSANGDGGDINIVIELDGDVVYKTVVKKNKQNTKRTGVNALAY